MSAVGVRCDLPVVLTIAYLGSRGLAQAGSRDFHDDTTNNDRDGAPDRR